MNSMHKKRVLVADHDLAFLDQIADRLYNMGMDVDFADSGRTAMRLASQEEYDLVVTEIAMPIHNGLDIMRSVKHNHPHVPILLFTFKDTQDFAIEAVEEGAYSYLMRPLHDLHAFDQAVQQAMNRTAQASQAAAPGTRVAAPEAVHFFPPKDFEQPKPVPRTINQIPDGILELNAGGQIISCNPAAKQWLIMDSSDAEHPLKSYILALASRAAPPEADFVTKDHKVHVKAHLINTESGKWRIGVLLEDKGISLQAQFDQARSFTPEAIPFEPQPVFSSQNVYSIPPTPETASISKDELVQTAKQTAAQASQTMLNTLEGLGENLWKGIQHLREVDWASYLPGRPERRPEEADPELVTAVSSRLTNLTAWRS